ncbi:variable large family protein (plasmid) [Borrelia miyamotoi]|uniref:Variable large protein n=1 Tax=Borrelia miyamotoi TaxID=47466 RepID=A0AAX3JQ82_9SPIR|nr:variable large family protein [Borrelia miyamotoi]WAZ72820.1 variable large family protein [Borrelia miyamotoi]
MTLFLGFVSCNSSGTVAEESPQSRFLKSVISLGNDFLNVFTSFGDMVGGVLGFNSNTKKSDVGAYFKKVHDTVEGTKTSLEKIVADMKTEGNPNAEATDTAVKKLVSETLIKITEGASEALKGAESDDPIGNVADQNGGAAGIGVDSLVKGIKGIVDVVLKGVGNADAGDDKKASDGSTARTANAADGEAGKLFASANAGDASNAKKSAADAAKAVGAVTGADILQAIIKDNGEAAKLAKETSGNVTVAPKDATIAGGIALRAMAKGGKFAGPSDNASVDAKKIVAGAAVSAVTKALDTLTIAIRKTIDLGLKEVQEAMKINASDTPVISDNKTSEAKSE